jgi:predicted aspartyl protease
LRQTCLGLLGWPRLGLAAVALERDRRGRLILATFINERGPFRFALDTGASLTVIARELAADLHLQSADTADVLIRGSTEDKPSKLVDIASLSVDQLHLDARRLGLVEPEQLDGLDGLLGADILQGSQIDLQLRDGQANIGAMIDVAGASGGVRLRTTRHFESLLAVAGRIQSTATPAILDTGAQRSIGNRALQRALGLHASDDANRAAVITGIAGGQTTADIIATPALHLGAISLAATNLLYADLPVFRSWGYHDRPALLLGMDLLAQLGRVLIDYRRTRVLIWR